MSANRSGFTMVEMLIAVVIMGVGLLALAGGSGSITRSLQGSQITTQASQVAAERMDMLRNVAKSTAIPCASGQFTSSGSPVVRGNVSTTWVVAPTGRQRQVTVTTAYRMRGGRTITQAFTSTILCS
jgi:prepilin-type N-terminal cleavage/methylation domain-containing protein